MLSRRWPLLAISVGVAACGGAAASDLLDSDASSQPDTHPVVLDGGTPDTSHMPDVGPPPKDSQPPPADVVTVMEAAPPPVETGPPDAGPSVYCGSTPCPIETGNCCVTTNNGGLSFGGGDASFTCEMPADPAHCQEEGSTPVECDKGADCPSGQCCGTLNDDDTGYTKVQCLPSCNEGLNQIPFCSVDAPSDCTLGTSCLESNLLPPYTVCM